MDKKKKRIVCLLFVNKCCFCPESFMLMLLTGMKYESNNLPLLQHFYYFLMHTLVLNQMSYETV